MGRVDADRNLLLGILAQQMDFVSRDALFDAMNAWIIRKETPLGALFVERGDLAKSRRDLLEALVDEHVHAHGGDPARSLQALSSVGTVVDDLGRLPDADVQASVSHLQIPETVPPPAGHFETLDPESMGRPTSWNGRFRIVRPHASGGLGVVSVALDDELDREVALKEIKDEIADHGARRARFVLEAEITGKLEHPGIIPIYGLGHDPAGRPFYAMRLIRGDSLAEAIYRYHDPNGPFLDPIKKSLQLRELLGRFLDVCDALAYAHSRGVLHRDLKPGNVMLGPFGETLVVDWGLALPLERVPEGHESTQGPVRTTKADSASLPREQGAVVGTPAYMPPEQAQGAIDRLGPRSDVYGLGAILYELLTGKRPVEGTSLEKVLHRVSHGEIKPPRQVRPEIPAPLEAVCLKALALKPEDRYVTPRALAADLKAWLADEPVSARREPFAERARRWAKRHRTAVTAAAAALLVGLVGLGGVAAVQTKARNDLDSKNADLEVQRRLAEENAAQAIDAVKKFSDVIANEPELKNNETLKDLRKRLLKEPLAFFRTLRDRLRADRDSHPESLALLADAGFELGVLTDEIGDKEDALIAFREELEVRKKLALDNPTLTQFRSDLARSYYHVGGLLRETGRRPEALEAYESARSVAQKLAEANPAVPGFQRALAATHNSIGLLLRDIGRPDEALKAHKTALTICQKLADDNPADAQFQAELAGSHNHTAMLLRAIGQPAEALKAHESALEIRRKLADDNPTDSRFQTELAGSHNNIGILLREAGRRAEALKAYESALAIRQKQAEASPAVTRLQSDLAASHFNIGTELNTNGKPAEALKSYQSALEIRRKLAEDNPTVTQFQTELAGSHNNIGVLMDSIGRPAEALKAYESAVPILLKLARDHPESPDFARNLGLTLNNLARIDLNAKRYEEARVRLRQAVVWQKKALITNPANPICRAALVTHLGNLLEAARGLGDSECAAEAEGELVQLRDSDPAMVGLDARLSEIRRGDQQPNDNRERLQLAQRAYEKALHATAAKLWADALDADPQLVEDRRTQTPCSAACAAALAGCGQGKDDPAPDDAAKARLRRQALGWLKSELVSWGKHLEPGSPQAGPAIVQTLNHWKLDGDLAGIRDAEALARLPEPERKEWQALWAEVEALLKRAQGQTP